MPKQMGFHVDSSACTNCKVCQIICKDKNDLPVAVTWRRVTQYGGGGWVPDGKLLVPQGIFTYSVSVSCMHCAKPACLRACPEKAITKRSDGVVLIDSRKCVGCRSCEQACPFGAPQFDAVKGIMTKCDFCYDLLAEGLNPACVDACPMRALHAGPLDQLQAKFGRTDTIGPLPPARTGPAVVITPHRHAQPGSKGSAKVIALPVEA